MGLFFWKKNSIIDQFAVSTADEFQDNRIIGDRPRFPARMGLGRKQEGELTSPRRARILLPDIPVHVIRRENNRIACFVADEDYQFYLVQLGEACRDVDVRLHAYVPMTNHAHRLMTANQAEGPSRVMKRLGQPYVQYVNGSYRRSGTLWEGRFRSCLVGKEGYLPGCCRCVKLNPVRAGMVAHPACYRWSSYRCNRHGERDPLVSAHPVYRALGKDDRERRGAYRALFRTLLEPGFIDEIRRSTNGGFVLGSERFQKQIAAMLGRRTWRGAPGRPRTGEDSEAPTGSGLSFGKMSAKTWSVPIYLLSSRRYTGVRCAPAPGVLRPKPTGRGLLCAACCG